ncbi:MAG TPA: hypothetical protein VL494_13695 [Steroidobacteraceae bacterium]|jgi:hypothetical protein|nr:hypothetical protein [Steroidobacteraceae bacterium]
MQLKFYAREDALVREAGVHPRIGEATRYYGRSFDTATRGYPADKEPFVVESDTEDGDKCAKQCRQKRALWAADEKTAAAIGVPFVPVEWKDGAVVAKAAPKKAEASGKGDS